MNTTASRPRRRTWKGHGNPAAGTFYPASGERPSLTGSRVKIALESGRVVARDYYSGQPLISVNPALKFWLEVEPEGAPAPRTTAEEIADRLIFRDGWPVGADVEDSAANELVIRLANGQRFCVTVHEL
jgi:hypothetical protein